MALKKPSDFFQKPEVIEQAPQVTQPSQEYVVSSTIAESFEKFKDNIGKLDALSESVQSFSESLSNKVDNPVIIKPKLPSSINVTKVDSIVNVKPKSKE